MIFTICSSTYRDKKRESKFIRLDFRNLQFESSKIDTLQIDRKRATLHSIKEHPSEEQYLDMKTPKFNEVIVLE